MLFNKIYEVLNKKYKENFAYDWDNVGLLLGREDKEVCKILICMDVTSNVVKKAIDEKVDLIIAHHPLIFRSIKNITNKDIIGKKILDLIREDITVLALHTNFDIAKNGMGVYASEILKLRDIEALEDAKIEDDEYFGLGVIGELNDEISLDKFLKLLKQEFSLSKVVLYSKEKENVKKVAILPGSGAKYYKMAKEKGADIFITGDVSHHDAIDAIDYGINIVDAGHYGIEKIFVKKIEKELKNIDEKLEIILFFEDNKIFL